MQLEAAPGERLYAVENTCGSNVWLHAAVQTLWCLLCPPINAGINRGESPCKPTASPFGACCSTDNQVDTAMWGSCVHSLVFIMKASRMRLVACFRLANMQVLFHWRALNLTQNFEQTPAMIRKQAKVPGIFLARDMLSRLLSPSPGPRSAHGAAQPETHAKTVNGLLQGPSGHSVTVWVRPGRFVEDVLMHAFCCPLALAQGETACDCVHQLCMYRHVSL